MNHSSPVFSDEHPRNKLSERRASSDFRAPAGLAELVREQVESLKFGTVLVTVHDSKIVQIERNEKTRLERPH